MVKRCWAIVEDVTKVVRDWLELHALEVLRFDFCTASFRRSVSYSQSTLLSEKRIHLSRRVVALAFCYVAIDTWTGILERYNTDKSLDHVRKLPSDFDSSEIGLGGLKY